MTGVVGFGNPKCERCGIRHVPGPCISYEGSIAEALELRNATPDIVERLKRLAAHSNSDRPDCSLVHRSLITEAAAEIERLRADNARKTEALESCDSTLLLCSERIASDRVAMDAFVKAVEMPQSKNTINALKQQDAIDRYTFAAIDESRARARAALSTPEKG